MPAGACGSPAFVARPSSHCSLALGATEAWVRAHPELRRDPASADANEPHWTTTVLLALALAVVVAIPSAGMWPLLLLLLTGPVDGLRRTRRAR